VTIWRNKAEWELWGDRLIDGVTYNFEHLRSFDMQVTRPAKGEWPAFNATVRVVFDCHVVTEAIDFIGEGPAYWTDIGGNGRMFELERFQYSQSLPSMMSGLPSGLTKCYFAAKNNYMIWKPAALSGPGHYQVYFDIYMPEMQPIGTTLLILYVQSAFLRTVPHTEQREKFTPFVAICGKLAGVVEPKKKGPRSKAKGKKVIAGM
jgi:hypothetical protein